VADISSTRGRGRRTRLTALAGALAILVVTFFVTSDLPTGLGLFDELYRTHPTLVVYIQPARPSRRRCPRHAGSGKCRSTGRCGRCPAVAGSGRYWPPRHPGREASAVSRTVTPASSALRTSLERRHKPPSSECRHHVRPGGRRVVAAQQQRREDSAAVQVAVRQPGRGDRLADLAPDILALGETGERSNGDPSGPPGCRS
jgi:hypothetical protein